MRIIVLSDSHGNARTVAEILKNHREDAAAFIHLGDGMKEWMSLKRKFRDLPMYEVRGNCDGLCDVPAVRLLELGGFRLFCTHGYLYSVKSELDTLAYAAQEQQADIALYGHTHVARQDEIGGVTLLNPGSVTFSSQTPRGYLVLDLVGKAVIPSFCEL